MKEPVWENCSEEELWKFVAWHLEQAGVDSVLVGGAVVAIYTEGLYQSNDLDIVPDDFSRKELHEVLASLGFERTRGRHYQHPRCNHLFLEFPPGPVSLGEEYPITPAEITVEGRSLKLLSPTDCVKDRLASYIHWNVRDTFDQAVLVALRQPGRVDLENVQRWCKREDAPDTFREFLKALEAEAHKD